MAQTQVALTTPPPPGLQEATKNSTLAWQQDLEALFHHAKDRFPDVVWELVGSEEDENRVFEEVWGHKAIVYARAPPSFQSRYFSFRANGAVSPVPYSSSPSYPGESALSLGLESSVNLLDRTPSPSPSTASHTQTQIQPPPQTTLLRLTTSINPSLFSDELEYLYTGKGFGEAFEFLFDSSSDSQRDRLPGGDDMQKDDPEAVRIDKLRKDLVFMWRSRLYSDVRIALTGNFGGAHENTTAIFSSHRFILVSRSPYFHTALISWPQSQSSSANGGGEPPTLTLPSPPFTPASLHFTLGFIYTGTLIFSHRSYDLSTALSILRASLYLSLTTLHDEVQARIVQEMLHGLFHAFIPFAEYESLTQGRWGTGGCRCRQCARRAPRVLEFAMEDDVRNAALERGARRALVGMFGEGWCTQEFAGLPLKLRESLLRGLAKRTTPENVFALLFAAEHALQKLSVIIEPWGDIVRDMIVQGRKGVEEVLARESERCFEMPEWMEIMEDGGVRFEDGERVEWAMGAVLRGVREGCAGVLYQTLVSSILLRPHPTLPTAPFLPATSHVHVQVEQARVELLKWIGKRWLVVRQERGFDELEGWALKEIGDHIEVPIDDLLSPPSYSSNKGPSPSPSHSPSTSSLSPSTALKRQTKINHNHNHNQQHKLKHQHLRPMSNHPHTSKVDAESDVASSMRVSVLSRSIAGSTASASGRHANASSRGSVASSSMSMRERDGDGDGDGDQNSLAPSNDARSVRSSAASTHSVRSVASTSTISAARHVTVQRSAGGNSNNNNNANNSNDNSNGEKEKMSPAKRIASEVRAANAAKIPEREKERPDSKLTPSGLGLGLRTPSIVEPDGVGESDMYLTEEKEDEQQDIEDEGVDVGEDTEGEDRESLVDVEGEVDGGAREEGEEGEGEVANSEANESESVSGEQDDTKSLTSDVPSVYHTPRRTGQRTPAVASVASASASSTISRVTGTGTGTGTGSRAGVRTTTGTGAVMNVSRPRSLAPSLKSQTPPRKAVVSTSTSSVRTSQYSSAASSRPSSRGSTNSVTPRTPRLASTVGAKYSPGSPSSKPSSRPVSRVSTRSISGGNRPVSSASTATTDAGSASTYRTAPAPGGGLGVAQRQRRTSATSTTSTRTAGGRSAAGSPVHTRARRISGASVSSVASNASSVRSGVATGAGTRARTTPVKRAPPMPDPTKLSPAVAGARAGSRAGAKAPGQIQQSVSASSSSSVRSAVSVASVASASTAASTTKKLSVGAAGATAASAARSRTLSHKKSTESMRKPVGAGKTKAKAKEEDAPPPVPPSPAASVPPELPSKDVEEKENIMPLATQVPPVVPAPVPISVTTTTTTTAPLTTATDETQAALPANTSSTMTVRQKVYSDNEHKKTSSSASSSSVATLRRKGSTDTIKTVKSSGLSSVTTSADGSAKAASTSPLSQGKNLPTSPPLPPLPLSSSSSTPSSLSQPKKPALTKQLSSIDSLLASDVPTGSTLEIGIPCIISSKRKRFKAYARYIGEVAGETGPWVGVEVPMPTGGDSWGDGSGSGFGSAFSSINIGTGGAGSGEKADDRQWNDGSWGGIRYFEIGGMMLGSEWEYGAEERAARRRRIDAGSVGGAVWGGSSILRDNNRMLKREGDQLSIASDRMKRMRSVSPAQSDMSGTESRGLFVRPQQVLYVVDAVGADL